MITCFQSNRPALLRTTHVAEISINHHRFVNSQQCTSLCSQKNCVFTVRGSAQVTLEKQSTMLVSADRERWMICCSCRNWFHCRELRHPWECAFINRPLDTLFCTVHCHSWDQFIIVRTRRACN